MQLSLTDKLARVTYLFFCNKVLCNKLKLLHSKLLQRAYLKILFMKQLKSLRAKYGFTQEVAATLLGVTHSQLALVETGKRSLPKHALELMAELETHADLSPVQRQKVKVQGDYAKMMIREYTLELKGLIEFDEECHYKILTIRRKLEPLQKRRNNALEALASLLYLRTIKKLGKGELAAVYKTEADARRSLRLVPQIMVYELSLELEALQSISDQIEEKINRLNELLKHV
jgi:transcriptional regulator with XRE-family HTH domain